MSARDWPTGTRCRPRSSGPRHTSSRRGTSGLRRTTGARHPTRLRSCRAADFTGREHLRSSGPAPRHVGPAHPAVRQSGMQTPARAREVALVRKVVIHRPECELSRAPVGEDLQRSLEGPVPLGIGGEQVVEVVGHGSSTEVMNPGGTSSGGPPCRSRLAATGSSTGTTSSGTRLVFSKPVGLALKLLTCRQDATV